MQAERDARFSREALALRESPPPRGWHAQRVADYLSGDVFPPDVNGAIASVAYALRLDPMDSAAWMRLARLRLLQGRDGEARAALEFSDRLDPRFPRQRLEAVRLWFLLGEPDRALDLADQIAGLGGSFREEAAGELVLSGVAATEVFDSLGAADLPAEELVPLLRRLHQSTPDRRALWARVPPGAYRDAEFRREAARMLMQPPEPLLLLDVWRLSLDPGRDDASSHELLLENADLSRSPRWEGFPLGWQPITPSNGHDMRWISPSAMSQGGGSLQLEIGRFGSPRMEWSAYRAILPAGLGARLRVPVRHREPVGARARLSAVVDGEWVTSGWSNGLRDGWQDLVVTIEPADHPRVLGIHLRWEVASDGLRRATEALQVGGIDLRAVPAGEGSPR